MALFRLEAKPVQRAKRHSAVGAAAYRAGEKLRDERRRKTYDYRNRTTVLHTEILAPDNAPAWVYDRQRLWNAVEACEFRKDAQPAREISLALPRELNHDQQTALLRAFARHAFVARGMVADTAIHEEPASDGGTNPHAHILLTMRRLDGDKFGQKERAWNSRELLATWRSEWAEHVNRALSDAGSSARVDHRSLADQGIPRAPQPKLGHALHMHQRGKPSARYRHWEAVRHHNRVLAGLRLRPPRPVTPLEAIERFPRPSESLAENRGR